MRQWRDSAPWLRWAVAAQLLLLILGGGLLFSVTRTPSPQAQSALYHTLGAAPAAVTGNVVVVFRPEVRERDLRQILRSCHARLIDGPTAADAYILHVPAAERDHALTQLRHQAAIVLAEPIDSASGETP